MLHICRSKQLESSGIVQCPQFVVADAFQFRTSSTPCGDPLFFKFGGHGGERLKVDSIQLAEKPTTGVELGAWFLVLGAWFAKGEELRAKLARSSLNTRRSQEREKLSAVSKNYQPEPAFVDH